jgi:hypothetical protein
MKTVSKIFSIFSDFSPIFNILHPTYILLLYLYNSCIYVAICTVSTLAYLEQIPPELLHRLYGDRFSQ